MFHRSIWKPSAKDNINNFPKPKTIKQLQEFIGMIDFYHRFLPNIADTLSPLYTLLKGKPKSLTWSPDAETAFQKAKAQLAKATSLNFPHPNAKLQLTTDASETAIGAVLEQHINGQ